MKPNEVKTFTYVTVGIAAAFWLAIVAFIKSELFSVGSLKALNGSAAAVSVLWFIYFSWGWKWPYVRKILFRPNLNGTWIGEFKSDWKDSNGLGIAPGRFVLAIRQSFFSISVRAFSDKQKTNSYVESLVCDGDRGTKILAYLFQEKRTSDGAHGVRQGAAELDLIESTEMRLFEGEFWTHSGTTGFVRVKQASSEFQVESFFQATGNWPDAGAWASV